ncbi:hypothetical protein [Frankia sp. AgKG'84/4]|uniref:hypothetical protein n=1 Tax=Frankia sp. AgKG'84/4 TaxID=573490 RepID=UPI00200BF52C|nr:hypothetical protein [Frankia sp. AgKG'84/4]MCL9795885.1 hypothetical protein [Frankia sp. AgKG'84/4]
MLGTAGRVARVVGVLGCATALLALAACSDGGDPPTATNSAAGSGAATRPADTATTPVWGFAGLTSPDIQIGASTPITAAQSSGSWMTAGGSGASARVTVVHRATGSYRVSFPGIAVPGGRGVPLVTALDRAGTDTGQVASCHVVRWDAAGTAEEVDLTCRDAAGTPVDSAFSAMFTHVPDAAAVSPGGAYAYLRLDADAASAATAKPADAYSVSGPGTIEIHRVGAGHYTIDLIGPAFAKNGNNLQVNATGDSPIGCNALGRVVGKDRQSVFVGCANGATPTDSPFALLYTSGHALIPTDATSFAHAFTGVTRPGGPTQQPPIGPAENAWGWYSANSTGAVNQVRRLAIGRYEVTFPGVARGTDANQIQVTPYGEPTARCSALAAPASASGQPITVSVRCVNAAGQPADSYASVAYASARTGVDATPVPATPTAG